MNMNTQRRSNIELLRIICILFIIGDHFVGQTGIFDGSSFVKCFFYTSLCSLSKVSCSVFIIISAWFSKEEGSFRANRLIFTWLTALTYTLILTIYMFCKGYAVVGDLVNALLPIEKSPLWFAGYYIVLCLLSPWLNKLVSSSKKMTVLFLTIFACLQSLYVTITCDAGFFSNEIWTLIFIYVLTRYIKKYVDYEKISKYKHVLFWGLWLTIAVLRVVAMRRGIGFLLTYMETYRAYMQSIPNLVLAYCLFFIFLSAPIPYSKVINRIAKATFGIYCFHQVPIWYSYLWGELFKCEFHRNFLSGAGRMLYALIGIATVFVIGFAIESVRLFLMSMILKPNGKLSLVNEKVDSYFDFSGDIRVPKRFIRNCLIVCACYFCATRALNTGLVEKVFYSGKLSTDSDIVSEVDVTIECEEVNRSEGKTWVKVIIRNNGKGIVKLSSGKHPISMGISIVNAENEVVLLDYIHKAIKRGELKSGECMEMDFFLEDIQGLSEDSDNLRFELVQEGIGWIDSSAYVLDL